MTFMGSARRQPVAALPPTNDAMTTSPALTSRFFNPLMLWADLAYRTGDMLLSSSTVIRLRTEQMLRTALAPSAADLGEMALMGQEKLAAASEATTAMANQLHTLQYDLPQRAVRHGLEAASALVALALSTSPAQAADHTGRLLRATARSAAAGTHFGSGAARVAQRGLKPIHARATANALRLSAGAPAASDTDPA